MEDIKPEVADTPIATTEPVMKVAKPNMQKFLSTLAGAVSKGDVTPQQARELRQQLGITQAAFTKKKRDEAKAKNRRKMAKASKRRNRGLGKGQKRTGGLRVFSRT